MDFKLLTLTDVMSLSHMTSFHVFSYSLYFTDCSPKVKPIMHQDVVEISILIAE